MKLSSTNVRLAIGFGITLLLVIAIGSLGLYNMQLLASLTDKMYKHPLAVSNAVLEIDGDIIAIHRSMKDVALAKDDESIEAASRIVDRFEAEVHSDFEFIKERFLGDPSQIEDAHRTFADWKVIRDEVIALTREGKADEAAEITKGKGARHVEKIEAKMQALIDFARNKASQFLADAESSKNNVTVFMAVLLGLALVAGVYVASYTIRANKAHMAQLSKLSLAVEQSPSSVMITDTEGNIEYVNPKYTEITGYSSDEVIGRNPRILKSGKTTPDEYKELWKTITSGGEWQGEFQNRKKNGELYYESVLIAPIKNKEGEITHFLGVKEDITAHKQAEDALRRSEEKYHLLFEGSNDSIFIVDPSTHRFLDANENAARRLGYSRDELLTLTFDDIDTSIETGRNEAILRELEEKGSVIFEHAHRCKDGTVMPVEISSQVIDYDDRKVIQSCVRDITERKRAEEELEHHRNRLKELVGERTAELKAVNALLQGTFESLKDAVFVVTSKTRSIVACNPAVEEIFGFSEKEVLGRNTEFLHVNREMYEEFGRRLYPALDEDGVFHTEFQVRRKDGSTFFSEHTVTEIANDSGSRTGLVSVVRDISERKRAEREINLLQTLTQAISESPDFSSALEVALSETCKATGWDFGEAWIPNADKRAMVCSPAWYARIDRLNEFRERSEEFTFPAGVGLPGRVWATRQPEWDRDVSNLPESVFPRQRIAQESGIKAGLGVPIIANDKVIAVLVFFTLEAREEDEHLVKMVSAVATQMGSVFLRKRAEEELRESEEQYRALVETSQDLIWKCDATGRFTYLNPAWERTHGYNVEEMLGRPFTDFESEEAREKDLGEFRRHLEGGSVVGYETTHISKSGKEIHLVVNAVPLRDDSGKIIGTQGTANDITERRHSETLRESIYRIAEAVSETDSLQELFSSIHGIIEELMPAENIYIALYDSSSEMISFPYFVDQKEEVPAPYKLGNGVTEYVLRTGKTILVTPEVINELVEKGEVDQVGPPSIDWLGVPLKTRDKTIGVLAVQTYSEGVRYGEEEKKILEFISTQVAMAIERKRAEEELRERQERYQTLFEQSPYAIFVVDPETRKAVEFNDVILQILGYSREEFSQMTTDEYEASESPEETKAHIEKILKEGRDEFETKLRTKSGEIRNILVSIQVIELAGRTLFHNIARDITKQKRAEEEIHLLLTTTQAISESPDFSSALEVALLRTCESTGWDFGEAWIPSADGSALECSSAWYASTKNLKEFRRLSEKYTFPHNIGLPGKVLATRRPKWIRDLSAEPETDFPRSKLVKKAGLKGALGVPILADDQVLAVLVFFMFEARKEDERLVKMVTAVATQLGSLIQRKRAEEDRTRLAAAIEQSAEGIMITERDGTIRYVNPAIEKMSGYTQDEITGRHPRILVSGEHDKAFYKSLDDVIQSGETWTGQIINRRKDGTLYEVDETISPILDNQGKIINYVAVLRDITHEVFLEKQLHQSQKMEAIGTLAGGIAHDFNNIVQVIIGNTEIALDDELPKGSPARNSLKRVLQAGDRAKELIKQILTFSRRREQERKPVRLSSIVNDALKLLRASLPATIEIREESSTDSDVILADPTQIYQVLINLCTNAADAMREKGGVLKFNLAELDLDAGAAALYQNISLGRYIELTVSDTGQGMVSEVQERLFEPYFTTKRPGEGTGMGLAVVHGIVKSHGGAIKVESEPGKGSSFSFLFPQHKSKAPEEVEDVEIQAGEGERILFVDDEEDLVEVGQKILEGLGYKVVAMTSSAEALEAFREQPDKFDLVITDQTMPKMTGDELAAELMRIRPDLPVILCTGFSEKISPDKAREKGIREYVMKPYVKRDLAKTIRLALDSPE